MNSKQIAIGKTFEAWNKAGKYTKFFRWLCFRAALKNYEKSVAHLYPS